MRKTLVATALVAAVPFLAACTQNAESPSEADDASDARTLTVESSDTECTLSADQAPAGTLTFEVTNTGSQVTEFYLLGEDGLRIVAEVENVGPSLSRELTVNAPAGSLLHRVQAGDGRRGAPSRVHRHRRRAPTTRPRRVSRAGRRWSRRRPIATPTTSGTSPRSC